jgi:6-phosphogluconolactonase
VILSRFDDPAAASVALAEQVAGALQDGVSRRGTGSLALPGGRTPLALLRSLRDRPLEWNKVSVTLTDERWVPANDPGSNAALLRAELLLGAAAAARWFPLYDGSADASTAAANVWQSLHALPRPFDAVVLGMGEDGHFASLFAGNPALESALDSGAAPGCVAMRAPVPPHERLSLNLAALAQARRLFLLVTGTAKRELLLRAARHDADTILPVRALLTLRYPRPEVYWAP